MQMVRNTTGNMIDRVAAANAGNDAIVDADQGIRYTYREFLKEIERAAKGMMSLGIGEGDRVALWSTNRAEWIVAMLAAGKTGVIIVPIDSGSSIDDVRYILDQSEARAVILEVREGNEDVVAGVLSKKDGLCHLETAIVFGDKSSMNHILWSEVMRKGDETSDQRLKDRQERIRPGDSCAIMYTSGTTGSPKGVVVDHQSLVTDAMCIGERMGVTDRDRLCLTVPLSHLFGNTVITLTGLLRGAAIVIPCNIFSPEKVLSAVPKERCTAIYGSPSMFIRLLEQPEFSRNDWKSVKKGAMGGTACPKELMEKVVNEIGVMEMTAVYGISETVGVMCMTYPGDPVELRVSTVGSPLPCFEAKIMDPASGEELPPGQIGELCARGLVMKEYYKKPAATAGAIDREGWVHTGDLARKDENGYIRITGRQKEVIVRKGIEIYPSEVEEVACGLPQVSEVQVFAVPDREKGQEVAMWIKLKEGSVLTIEEIRDHCRLHLKESQLPGYFKFVSGFPTTPTGKYQKFKLTEMAVKEYGSKGR